MWIAIKYHSFPFVFTKYPCSSRLRVFFFKDPFLLQQPLLIIATIPYGLTAVSVLWSGYGAFPGTDRKLEMIEASIASTFSAFKNAVLTSDFEVIAPLTERLLTLIKNRNRQPGAMKQGPGRSLRG